MADNPIHEMISACATGCMDEENFLNFRSYVLRGGEMPAGELGEFLNIVALIPGVLEIEQPDPQLKKRVAKKLLTYQNEIKEKIKSQKYGKLSLEKEERTAAVKPEPAEKNEKIRSFSEINPDEVEPVPPNEMAKFNTLIREHDNSAENKEPAPKRISVIEKADKSSPIAGKLPWIILAVIIILFIAAFFFLSNMNSNLQSEIKLLKTQITNLQSKISDANIFIDQNKALIEFMNNRDLMVVDLTGTDKYRNVSGKLLVSFFNKQALLSMENLPPLQPDKVYKLWMVSRGQSLSLSSFIGREEIKFYKIDNIPSIPPDEIDLFRLTIEDANAGVLPSGEIVLYGSLMTAANKK